MQILRSFTSSVLIVASIGIVVVFGCHRSVPISTWQPAITQSGPTAQPKQPPRRIAFEPIRGPDPLRQRLEEAIGRSKPLGSAHLAVIQSANPIDGPSIKEPNGGPNATASLPVRLASHQKQLERATPIFTAKRQNVDVLIRGEITLADVDLQDSSSSEKITPNSPGAAMAALQQMSQPAKEKPGQIVVNWEAFDVESGLFVDAITVSMTTAQAKERYPDLAIVADPVDRLLMGVSRQTWSQYVPTIEEQKIEIDQPWVSWGAKEVRRGNTSATDGLWQEAEQYWQNAVSDHPKNKSAWHNLAVAAVAHEDFELARVRLAHSKGWVADKRFKETELWIDRQQKAYHRAFGLPPREGGWLDPDPPATPLPGETISVAPVDLEDLPWWTAIPGTKPPGWTWKAWLTQPLP